jgi:PAS domain S-box-containing protein
MTHTDPEIIKTLREEERLGKLRSNSSEEKTTDASEEYVDDSLLEPIFTILKHRQEEQTKTIDLGDPAEKYRIIFDYSAIAIMLTDENERIVHWNKATENLLGMSKEELMMRPVKCLYPEEEWKKIRSENIRQKGIHHHLETKMIRKDNKLVDVDISLSVLKDSIGNVIGSIGIVKDNTKNKEMERIIKTSEEKFKQLYEKAPVPYHTLSPDGTITNVNEKWCKIFGYTKNEVIGTPIFDYIHGDEQDIAKSSFKEKITSKKPFTGGHERTYITKNGEQRIFVINDFLSFNDPDAVMSVHSTMEDVTERKKTEEELRKAHYWLEKRVEERTIELSKFNTLLKKKINEHKRTVGELHIALEKLQKSQKRIEQQNARLKKLDRLKSNFLNITSHELRTSMATIKGYVEVLLMKSFGPINEEQKKGLDVILTNTNHLDHLIQEILDVSRLESGTMKFIPERTSVEKIIHDATETMQSSADNKQIKITNEVEQGIPELMVDKERIKQVLLNLLNNAIFFSPESSTISIRANKEPDEVLFEIQDFGHGIPKNKQKRMFDIFYQLDSGMDHHFGDIGLGLTISRGIVLSHGGKIWIESETGKGNIFRFTLPIKPIHDLGGKFKEVTVFRQ